MDKNIEIISINSKQTRNLSEKVIWFLMYIFSTIHGLICLSPGMLSSCITEIKAEFNLTNKQYGMFGTFIGLGSLLGSITFTFIIEKVSHKLLICSMLLINCASHLAFILKLKYSFLLISRFLNGFACVFCYMYFPMWVVKFAMKKWVNFMQTFVQVSYTIGNIFGYLLFLLLGETNWKYGFLLEIISIFSLDFILTLIPYKYYNKNYINPDNCENNTNDSFEGKVIKEKKISTISPVINQGEEKKETIIKDIFCNMPYILITLYRGNIFFIFSAINFWYSDYLQNSLLEKDPKKIFWSYSITMVFSSLIGNILGGVILNKIGGIKSRHSYVSMAVLQSLGVLFGLCAPFTDSTLIFTILMSLYILNNSASGIISITASFAVIPSTLIGTATGICSIVLNIIAFLPAPYAYSFLKSIVKKESYILTIFMFYGLFGVFEIMAADIYMRIKKIKIHKDNSKSLVEEK